jgi:hypothetical protein
MNIFQKIDTMKLSGLILFILIAMLITCSGCIKGGRTVDASTTGRTITSSELIRQPNGIYKLKPVKIEPVKSKPVPVEPKSAIAKPAYVKPESAIGKPTPFEPTVKEAKLSPAEILIEDLKNVGSENNVNINLPTEPEIAGPCEAEPAKGSGVKIDWAQLIKFYLIATMFFALMYFGFKAARKKTENMVKAERAKKTSAKKTKKKTAKKATKRITKKPK